MVVGVVTTTTTAGTVATPAVQPGAAGEVCGDLDTVTLSAALTVTSPTTSHVRRLHRNAKAAADVEYPAYGVTGPNKDISPTGDRRLAQSAQMYHYQHQKQQILAMENRAAGGRRGSMSEAESEDENEEGDYTVYECPGLAPTQEMEVKNPLFQDDPTPATPAPGMGAEAGSDGDGLPEGGNGSTRKTATTASRKPPEDGKSGGSGNSLKPNGRPSSGKADGKP
ncbi:hypothetical protein ONE63_001511 [Megalurothrips usitatus]|uniref:Neural proliferation differentiation and control protein 1-like n=1 Tax=Megalurothrips usitatus TaxID=439358 RepID=A0AAV7XJM9_9NEOP|nr:hypothetical protein ONE63_001511 [Megalurothrips usitatus]